MNQEDTDMGGMNLGDIVADAQGRETDFFADRLMELLRDHVPEPQQAAFMAKLSSIMESIEDTHPVRVRLFNEVHGRLHAKNQQR